MKIIVRQGFLVVWLIFIMVVGLVNGMKKQKNKKNSQDEEFKSLFFQYYDSKDDKIKKKILKILENNFDSNVLNEAIELGKKHKKKRTALYIAVYNNDLDIVKLLLHKHPTVDKDTWNRAVKNFYKPKRFKKITDQIKNNIEEIFVALIDKADIDFTEEKNFTNLKEILRTCKNSEIFKRLIPKLKTKLLKDVETNVLLPAINNLDLDLVTLLIQDAESKVSKNAWVKIFNEFHNSKENKIQKEIIKILIPKVAADLLNFDVITHKSMARSALWVAINKLDFDVTQMLIKRSVEEKVTNLNSMFKVIYDKYDELKKKNSDNNTINRLKHMLHLCKEYVSIENKNKIKELDLISTVSTLKGTQIEKKTFKSTQIPEGNFIVLSLAIFLDTGSEYYEMEDEAQKPNPTIPTLAETLNQAIKQKTSVLTSASILQGLALLKANNPLPEIFNNKKWTVYLTRPKNNNRSSTNEEDAYFLLLYDNNNSLNDLGLNSTKFIKIDSQNQFDEESKNILQRSLDIELFKSIFLLQKEPVKFLYLSGHGTYQKTISKLPIADYQKLLKFFEEIGCMFLLVDTCQTGGANVILGHQQVKTGLEEKENPELYDISYPIAIQGFTDVSVIATKHYDFQSFFRDLKAFYYKKKGEQIAYWHREPFKTILSHVSGKAFVNTQQIKFPHFRGFFEILDADNFVTAITYPRLLAHELDKPKTKIANQPKTLSNLDKLQELNTQKEYLQDHKTSNNQKKINELDTQIEQLKKQTKIPTNQIKKTKILTPLEIDAGKLYAILLYPSVITIPLHITSKNTILMYRKLTDTHEGSEYLDTFPALESMIPGNTLHYLHELQLICSDWKKEYSKYYCIACLFGKISKRVSHKLFFIKSLTLPSKKIYENSLIHSYQNENKNKNNKNFIIDWYLPNSSKINTFSRTRLSIPQLSSQWYFDRDDNLNIKNMTVEIEEVSSSSQEFLSMLKITIPSKEALFQSSGGRETEATFKKILDKNYPEITKLLKTV